MAWYDSEKETLTDVLKARSQWLRVSVTKNEHGAYDVSLRLDGSYPFVETAESQADFFRKELKPFLAGMRLSDWDE